MRQLIRISSLLLVSVYLNASESPRAVLGTVEMVEGTVYMVELGTQAKKMLSAGQAVYEGVMIQTDQKSKIIIRLNNGILKYIPAESKISFVGKNYLEIYKKTDEGAKKVTATLGTKASEKNLWIEDEPAFLRSVQKLFYQQKYLDTVKAIEQYQGKISLPELLFIAAFSYFKVGNEKSSIFYFEKLIVLKSEEYQEKAYFCLFLNFLRLGQKEKAHEMLLKFSAQYEESSFLAVMKEMME